jgi:hypothetical protein
MNVSPQATSILAVVPSLAGTHTSRDTANHRPNLHR